MLAFVESQLGGAGKVSEKVYRELTEHYGFSPRAAETYRLHAAQDEGHGSRQIDAIRLLANDRETQDKVRAAVKLRRDGFHSGMGRPCPSDDRQERILEWSRRSEAAATESQVAKFLKLSTNFRTLFQSIWFSPPSRVREGEDLIFTEAPPS